ncbi:MAG: hypothetical protein IJP13_05800 [Lachnospiraceae bacterium]|nr:hypothetical protein [Lachnospiraceae bacterium]
MMKRKNVIIILTLLVIVLLAACGNDKTNENNETMDNRKFTQEKISELEKEVKGGTHEFAILVSVEERYNVSAGNYEVTDGKQTDEYTYTVYGTIKIKDKNGKIQDKNIIVTYQLVDGKPALASVALQ